MLPTGETVSPGRWEKGWGGEDWRRDSPAATTMLMTRRTMKTMETMRAMQRMLSRKRTRALLDSQWPLPPSFLLPCAKSMTTLSHSTEAGHVPPPLLDAASQVSAERQQARPSQAEAALPSPPSQSSPPALSASVRELLPVLQAQGPHYITAHLYDRPYLLTQGDILRLPFHLKGVQPGHVLRLNRASLLGSRDYTLKAAAPAPALKSPTMSSVATIDPTTGPRASESTIMPESGSAVAGRTVMAPHFIPHIAKGKVSYLDERLFVCRAVVMGVESEPMRVVEKTKRRQRKVKRVKSKHRHTVLRIKEVRIRGLEEIERGEVD